MLIKSQYDVDLTQVNAVVEPVAFMQNLENAAMQNIGIHMQKVFGLSHSKSEMESYKGVLDNKFYPQQENHPYKDRYRLEFAMLSYSQLKLIFQMLDLLDIASTALPDATKFKSATQTIRDEIMNK